MQKKLGVKIEPAATLECLSLLDKHYFSTKLATYFSIKVFN